MEDSLESEVQISSVGGPSAADEGLLAPEIPGLPELSVDTKLLISRCMDGTEPLGRDLKSNEPEKLTPLAVNAILLRSAGFRGKDIKALIGLELSTISVLCNHPYGKKILRAMMHTQGARILDLKTKLLEGADQLIDHALALALAEEDTETVAKVSFGFLDRAGYGPTQKHESTVEHKTPSLAPASPYLPRIMHALEQSNRIDAQIMPTYRQSKPPEDTVVSEVSRDPFEVEEKAQLKLTGTDDA